MAQEDEDRAQAYRESLAAQATNTAELLAKLTGNPTSAAVYFADWQPILRKDARLSGPAEVVDHRPRQNNSDPL